VDETCGRGPWDEALPRADDLLTGGGPERFTARLDAWLADARVDVSAAARSRERWLRAAAEADATLGGVLADLAERRTPVAIAMSGGRRHHGAIEVVGADFVALRLASAAEVLVAMAAMAAVRTTPLADVAVGERVVSTELCLAEVLGELAADRARVLLVLVDGNDAVGGELRSVGQDVLTVRTDGDPPATAYVPLRAVAEVVLG
jgi:hypothetical protein